MKGLLVFFSLLLSSTAFSAPFSGTSISELALTCDGTLKIQKVGKVSFDPGREAQGRAPDIQPSASIQVQVGIDHLNSVGCSVLASKYHLDLHSTFNADVIVDRPTSLESVKDFAKLLEPEAAGQKPKIVVFNLVQNFGYVYNEKYLPLYPEIVEETLALQGDIWENSQLHLIVPLDIDVHKVYGTTEVSTWNDQQKLALAQRLVWLQNDLGTASYLSSFSSLFLSLNFQNPQDQQEQLQLIWKLFKSVEQTPFTQFFNFETGGAGFLVGSPFAEKMKELMNKVATDRQKLEILYSYPSLFSMFFGSKQCPAITSDQFTALVQEWTENFDSLMPEPKRLLKEVLQTAIAVDPASGQSWGRGCAAALVTPSNLKSVEQLLSLYDVTPNRN